MIGGVERIGARHATAHPPSDGAHRLAWWIGEQADGEVAIEALATAMDAPVSLVDRLLRGAVEPDDGIAAAIAAATGGAVLPGDWMRGGPLGWHERPHARPDELEGAA